MTLCTAIILCIVLVQTSGAFVFSIDDLENHISPDDIAELSKWRADGSVSPEGSPPTPDGTPLLANADYDDFNHTATHHSHEHGDGKRSPLLPERVNCFGMEALTKLSFIFNLRPASSRDINTHFYFTTRKQRNRVQVFAGEQFGLEWVDFDPGRRTAIIVHGFLSYSNASWVVRMTDAWLRREDVNVITVDWSGGGNTWKYWRAVANTRSVGADLTQLLQQLIDATGVHTHDFHFVGHSLGAHICSYAAARLGGVRRITGLDPAQPCFTSKDKTVMLDSSDAEFVDVIHTNGRLLKRLGFGMPDPSGHADFYPNGGMIQPGCHTKRNFFSRLFPVSPSKFTDAICSHGRAYLLFTESLTSNNCTFRAHQWNMTLEGVNASLEAPCDRVGACAEMGIGAAGVPGHGARGAYFVLTADTKPFCPTEYQRHHPNPTLLKDLAHGFHLDRSRYNATTPGSANEPDSGYADPDIAFEEPSHTKEAELFFAAPTPTTTQKPFWKFWKR